MNDLPADAVAAANAAFPEVAMIGFRCTDYGNSERLVARNRDRIRYCPPRKCWYVWDGRRWARDETGEIIRLAKRTVRAIYGEAEKCTEPAIRAAIATHARNSEKGPRLREMVTLAQSEPGIPVLPDELDADPWLLNVQNGTVDLRTGKVHAHRRGDLITKLVPAKYDPAAESELWFRFVVDVTGGDTELAAYLRRSVGYALQGTVTEKAFWFLYGPPDGMKSTFIATIASAIGDYAATASFTTWLVQTSTGGNRGDLVSLFGARLVTSVECRKGARFDEEILKRVTGGDELKAAAKYEAEVTFKPTFALWLAGNDAPVIRDDDEGAWSRVRRVPFLNALPKKRQDRKMPAKLRAAEVQSAILAWAVGGCLEWQSEGLGTCPAIEQSTAEYRAEMDRAAGFFGERCVFGAVERVVARTLRAEYEAWCSEQGVPHPLAGKEFGKRLGERGCRAIKSNGVRCWDGVRLLANDEEPQGSRVGRVAWGTQSQETPLMRGIVEGLPEKHALADPADPASSEARENPPENGETLVSGGADSDVKDATEPGPKAAVGWKRRISPP